MNIAELKNSPCGHLIPTDEGQWAFVPDPLPRHVTLSPSMVFILDKASRAVATLAGVGETLQNPHLLIRPFIRREAVLSSRIEGTQASVSDVFRFEATGERRTLSDTIEVANYVSALEYGISLLNRLPICIRLANEVHAQLLQGVRGEDRRPGELRPRQNWISGEGVSIKEARYIPPPANLVPELLADWESFVNEALEMPPLIQCALMHYQFEAIHPYLDGNGRVGRLLIILYLCANKVLPTPLLYLSAYFDLYRSEYYDLRFKTSATGNWEPWLRFFLNGVAEQANDALIRSRRIRQLQEEYRDRLHKHHQSGNTLYLLEKLFENPFVTRPMASKMLDITLTGARNLLERLVSIGILQPLPGTWPQFYVASELLQIIEAPVVSDQ